MGLKWDRHESGLEYVAGDRDVVIDYCRGAVGQVWRVNDFRGCSKARPKPLEFTLSFHSTLAEAKAWANGNDWHLAS